jgi:hypothetical protein
LQRQGGSLQMKRKNGELRCYEFREEPENRHLPSTSLFLNTTIVGRPVVNLTRWKCLNGYFHHRLKPLYYAPCCTVPIPLIKEMITITSCPLAKLLVLDSGLIQTGFVYLEYDGN